MSIQNPETDDQVAELKREIAKKDAKIKELTNEMEGMKVHQLRPSKMKLAKAMKKDMKMRKTQKKIIRQKIKEYVMHIEDMMKNVRL
jgi:hypothetical protein